MPYQWTSPASDSSQKLQLWPHQSLPPRGMALFILATFAMLLLPLVALLGTVIMWGLLPFLLGALAAMYFALRRNNRALQISETLTLTSEVAQLIRVDPNGKTQKWQCNRYWARAKKYCDGGPVPHYVTLSGDGREVEIGAFLSEDERIDLFDDLSRALRRA